MTGKNQLLIWSTFLMDNTLEFVLIYLNTNLYYNKILNRTILIIFFSLKISS